MVKVGIIGAGSIGMLLAGYIASSSKSEVTLFTNTGEQAELFEKNGLQIKRATQTETRFINAKQLEAVNLAAFDVIYIAVKQYHLDAVLSRLSGTLPAVVFLQNGMSHINKLKRLNASSILLGIMEHGAKRLSPTKVEHTGNGILQLGVYSGDQFIAEQICSSLNDVSLSAAVAEDWLESLEKKLIANACINPLTAMFGIENGKLLQNTHITFLLERIFLESVEALKKDNPQLLWDSVKQIITNTAINRSSMLCDIEANRKTEIDAITGYLLSRGEKSKMPFSEFVYCSIKGLEIEERKTI